ncbi:hypothetical protein FRB95_012120 [Tulasnella sp. JGI-2019a]|nr:hypothetical protein FRB95_012120 [Tulasnella sp. JGI-2019a]
MSTSSFDNTFDTPPSFEESQTSINALFQNDNDRETEALLPPDFSEYQAEYSTKTGNIISHDEHLNKDGEALCRFLLSKASIPPALYLRCNASHKEWHTREIIHEKDGKSSTSIESYSRDVVDFDFTIDISDAILPAPPTGAPIWLVGDKHAAYRGGKQLQVDGAPTTITDVNVDGHPVSWRRKALKLEKEATAAWKKCREDGGPSIRSVRPLVSMLTRSSIGYAPWVLIRGMIRGIEACVEREDVRLQLQHATNDPADLTDDSDILPPTKTLRDWTDEYCSSESLLKEFTFEKIVYGWNFGSLRQAVENIVRSNYAHSTKPNISFDFKGSMISVHPSTWYSRMLSKTWVFVILCITLIYPLFIWPFKRFARRGGGEWRVAGSAFALTRYHHLADSISGETVDEYRQRTNTTLGSTTNTLISVRSPAEFKLLKATPKGVAELVGQREGQWFAQWEDTIAGFVRQRYISSVPVSSPRGSFRSAGIGLDGYYPRI